MSGAGTSECELSPDGTVLHVANRVIEPCHREPHVINQVRCLTSHDHHGGQETSSSLVFVLNTTFVEHDHRDTNTGALSGFGQLACALTNSRVRWASPSTRARLRPSRLAGMVCRCRHGRRNSTAQSAWQAATVQAVKLLLLLLLLLLQAA